MLKHLITSFVVLASFDLMAASIDIALSDESAQFKYQAPMGGTTLGRSEMMAGFLYNDNDKYLVEAGVLVIDVAGSKTPGLELGVGPKLYYIDSDKGKATAMGLGGQVRYKMRQLPRYFVSGKAFFAPSIVAFGDAEDIFEIGAYVNYELLPTADIYLGYHHVHADFDAGTQTIDESLMFGLRFRY